GGLLGSLEADTGGRLIRVDQVRQGSLDAHAVAKHHVDLVRSGQPEREPVGEQVPNGDDVLGWVLDIGHDRESQSTALSSDLAEQLVHRARVVAVGGEHAQFVDDQDLVRVLDRRRVTTLALGSQVLLAMAEFVAEPFQRGYELVITSGETAGEQVTALFELHPAFAVDARQFHQTVMDGRAECAEWVPDQRALAGAGRAADEDLLPANGDRGGFAVFVFADRDRVQVDRVRVFGDLGCLHRFLERWFTHDRQFQLLRLALDRQYTQ